MKCNPIFYDIPLSMDNKEDKTRGGKKSVFWQNLKSIKIQAIILQIRL